ncbi:MAG: hypothetical protein IPJ43_16965 [Saprospiraceae bacterium]|nr:hypothetical protein [Saprospiraceae bacterium]
MWKWDKCFVAENWGGGGLLAIPQELLLSLAKQRLMTANFEYFQLAYPSEGVGSGFIYKKFHI